MTTAAAQALDDPREWQAFGREVSGRAGCWESFLAIQGMHCAACSLTIEQVLGSLPGVREVQVSAAAETARVLWSPGTARPSQWVEALAAAGYGALPAGDALPAAQRRAAGRLLLWRWLVAGFCMMQVMMYAVPAYTAAPGDITADQQALLRWASWILSLPVLLFSCGPFFSSAWRCLRLRRIGMDVPVALGVLIAFAASSAATFDPQGPLGGEVWFDSLTMFVFFLLSGRLLERRLRDSTAGSLEALLRRMPQTVERRDRQGSFERVPVRGLVPGDVVRVFAGEAIPADGVVLEGTSRVDEALLTGESAAVPRCAGDAVVAGSHNLAATLLVRVERVGEATRFAEIAALMERAAVEKPQAAQLADRIAGPFLWGVLIAAAAAAAAWWGQGPGQALGIAVAVLIVTCPCALSLATPAATLAAAGALARRGVLVRRLEALEAAASIDTLVFDKTGTLTQDRMAVGSVVTASHCAAAPESDSQRNARPDRLSQACAAQPSDAFERGGARIDAAQALRFAGALARHSLHPVSRAIVDAAPQAECEAHDVQEFAGAGLRGTCDGRTMRLGSAAFCGVPGNADLTQVHLADDGGWLATFTLEEALRADAVAALQAARAAGLRVELLSGDSAAAVQRIASRLGIETASGGRSPQDKLDRLRALQGQGARVAMVGDGMNDGPVLARADVSIAMGHGVPLAQARSDFVLLGSNPAAVPMLLAHARRTRSVIRQNLLWAAAYNAVCVPLALAGALPPWAAGLGMAASSLFVVVNAARLSLTPQLVTHAKAGVSATASSTAAAAAAANTLD